MKTLNATKPGEAVVLDGDVNTNDNPCEEHRDVKVEGFCPVCLIHEVEELRGKVKTLELGPNMHQTPPTGKKPYSSLPPIKTKLPVPKMKPPKEEEPDVPKGYGELKVGMEGMLNGVPVRIRKITKKDIILRPLNKSIRGEAGMLVSFKEGKQCPK